LKQTGQANILPANTLLQALKLNKASIQSKPFMPAPEKYIATAYPFLIVPQVIKLFRKICRRKYK